MNAAQRFEAYLAHLAEGLGHADRHAGLRGYCTGLMLPLERKSVEPIAASVAPLHVSARHQSLHHFVAKSEWSDDEMLRRVREWIRPQLGLEAGGFWIVDDTGFPKKGKHSVGVARQYCGALGKQDNCQVAVSVSLASRTARVPVSWQLYLPKAWAQDPARRQKTGVPDGIAFATKPQMALQHLKRLLSVGLPPYCVLADAGYGVDTALRHGLSQLGLPYMVGITSAISVWPPDVEPLSPKSYRGRGRPAVQPRRTAKRQPLSVKALAQALPESAYQTVRWREGTNQMLSCRFAAAGSPCRRQCRACPPVAAAVAADRMAARSGDAGEVLPVYASRHLHARRTGRCGASALADRARLSGAQTEIRTRPLRRAWLARLPSPCQSEHRGLWLPARRTPQRTQARLPKKPHTTPSACPTRSLRPARCSADRSATYRTRSPRCAIGSASCSPRPCHDVRAVGNGEQIHSYGTVKLG